MDNIKIEKIWEDTGFYEVEISCVTEKIKVKHKIYMNDGDLLRLSKAITIFLEENKIIVWNDTENKEIVALSFEFLKADKTGRVIINIHIKDDVMPFSCAFPVETTVGMLYEFAEKLSLFDGKPIGEKINLDYEW